MAPGSGSRLATQGRQPAPSSRQRQLHSAPRGLAVACGPEPDRHGSGRRRHSSDKAIDRFVIDGDPAALHPQDDGPSSIELSLLEAGLDEVGQDRVDQAVDADHVDEAVLAPYVYLGSDGTSDGYADHTEDQGNGGEKTPRSQLGLLVECSQRFLERLAYRHDAVEAGRVQETVEAGGGADDGNVAIGLANPTYAADQGSQTGGVHEGNLGEVDDEPLDVGDPTERLAKLADGVGVDFALESAYVELIVRFDVDLQHLQTPR